MRIEVRGVIQHREGTKTITELVVTEGRQDNYKKHTMAVDAVVNRRKVQSFLGGVYSIPPGDIIWPVHIKVD